MFQEIRLFFYKYFLQKELKKHQAKHEFVGLGQAMRIGILFDSTDEQNIPIIFEYSKQLEKKMKKRVKVLGFIDANQGENLSLNYDTFSRRHTSWYFRPKKEHIKPFITERFDILINAYLHDSPALEYISTFSNATFRVGPYNANKTYCFDMMITTEGESLEEFINKVHHFLEKINNEQAV